MEQPRYNMFHREQVEKEYLPLYGKIGLGTTTWSPLESGLLTGKYNEGIPPGTRGALEGYEWLGRETFTPDKVATVKALQPIANELGCSMAQLALAWCRKNDNVSTVITGATRPEQVEENMRSLEFVPALTTDVMGRIDGILKNRP